MLAPQSLRDFAEHRPLVLAMGLLLTGCSNTSDIAVDKERAASLAGSADMTAKEWLAGAVPTHFAQRALADISEALSDSMEKIRADTEGGDSEARKLLAPLTSLKLAVDQLNVNRHARRQPFDDGD